ncbi:MAG: extracellular solute-binding protein [Oscillospiraceae bacterium]|nr:extracellular solute-binding protein [Oscillospiraceae bacterium]
MTRKVLALLLALTMILALFAGCGSASAPASVGESASQADSEEAPAEAEAVAEPAAEPAVEPDAPAEESSAAEPAELAEEPEEIEYASMSEKYFAMTVETNHKYKELQDGVKDVISYPLDGGETLSMWRVFSAFIWNGLMNSYAEAPTMPLIEEATGVKMNFIECSDSAAWEQFNLTIASGDYPDLMSMDYYSGGVASAYDDEIIIDMTDLIETEMPNYKAVLDTMDDYTMKSVYTDDDKMLRIFTFVSNVVSEQGLSYRADWAEENGMDAIVTTDDMFDYLSYVKSTYDCRYPIFIDNSGVLEGFTGAWGTPGINLGWTDLGMYLEGDTVVSTLTDEHFRNYLEGFHRFYEAGLIKDDFYSEGYGPDYINSYVSEDQCAVTSIRGDKFTTMTEAALSPSFHFVATAPLVEEEGGSYDFLMKTNYIGMGNMSITTGCDDPELAAHFLNWFFTYDGFILTNFGEEGVAFEYDADGNPVYTDFIVNNPDGYNPMNLRNMYTNPVFNNYNNSTSIFYTYDEVELDAFDVWNNNGTSDKSMPTLNLTTEESSEYSNIASTVFTYATEQILKWMIGEAELTDENWDAYCAQCESMDLQRCVEIYQTVYDRMYK